MPFWSFDTSAKAQLEMMHPDLQHLLRETLSESPLEFTIASSSVRTQEEQDKRIADGHSTYHDSRHVVRVPRHLHSDISGMPIHPELMSHAADIIIYSGEGRAIDTSEEAMKVVAAVFRKVARKENIAMRWGGEWEPPKPLHFELCSESYPSKI